MSEKQIYGVQIKELRSFPDDRGFFREVIRVTDPFFEPSQNFAQWSHSKMGQNTVKAWHFHHLQTDWWYCPLGLIQTVLFDLREESPTYRAKMEIWMGEKELDSRVQDVVVRIPPGVAHGCRVYSPFAHLFYITNQTYNPNDEGRYPFNSPEVEHQWGEGDWIVSEKDRNLFIPTNPRQKLAL